MQRGKEQVAGGWSPVCEDKVSILMAFILAMQLWRYLGIRIGGFNGIEKSINIII